MQSMRYRTPRGTVISSASTRQDYKLSYPPALLRSVIDFPSTVRHLYAHHLVTLENSTFPSSCHENELFLALEPSEASVDWFSVVYNAGAVVGLLLQVTLAQWFLSWFSLLQPLIKNRGTILLPQ